MPRNVDISITPVDTSGGAPQDGSYVTILAEPGLTNERVLTAGTNIAIVDGGIGGNVTISSTGGGGGAGYTMAPQTFLGRATGTTGIPEIVLGSTATSFLSTFTTSQKGLVPGPTTIQVTNRYPLRSDGTWSQLIGAQAIWNNVSTTTEFQQSASFGATAQASWYFNNLGASSFFTVFHDPTGSKKYWLLDCFAGAPAHYLFLGSGDAGLGVIAQDWIGVAKLSSPDTVGPTLYSSSYPAYYAGSDDKAYFKGGSGVITQLTAPTITQMGGTQIAYSTRTYNFAGAGVSAVASGELVTVNIPGGSGSGLSEAEVYARVAYGM